MDDTAIFCIEINLVTVKVVTFFEEELRKVGVTLNETKTGTLPQLGHRSMSREEALLAVVQINPMKEGGAVVEGILVSMVLRHACGRDDSFNDA